jgi:hypothetical protein
MAITAVFEEEVMKLQFVDEAKRFWTLYSIWAFAIVGIAPDLYNLAIQYNLLSGEAAPAKLAYIINVIAFAGAASRLVKQKKLEADVAKLQEQAAAKELENKG